MDGADGVYPASEDTYLLIDALKQDEDFLREQFKGGLCIEVGCGSGEVCEALASTLQDSICICTDVNCLAVQKTGRLLAQTGILNTDMVMTDMFTALRPGTEFDVIVFNPPYVPTDEEELQRALQSRDISASWAGGKDGRQVIDTFLSDVGDFLSRNSVVYLVLLDANKPEEVMENARRLGYSVKTVKQRKAGIEQLYILRFQKN